MLTVTEDKISIPLIPDAELCDVRIGVTDPALFFSIKLEKPSQVLIEFQEFNTASRCVLLLSPTDPHPSKHTAVWKHLSPDPNKMLTILPADPSYSLGTLYLAVRYVEDNGNSFIRLKLTLRDSYEAEWYSLINKSLYCGSWLGFYYHGFGRVIYGLDARNVEEGAVRWSAHSLRKQNSRSYRREEATPVARASLLGVSRREVSWSIIALPLLTAEVYEGEWVNGKKEGLGVYQWSDRSYWGMWKEGMREGFGVFCTSNGLHYEGEWHLDNKHGLGKAFYPDGSRYQGHWEDDVRSGEGLFVYSSGVAVTGKWENDELCPEVRANYPDGSFYVGEWTKGCRHGNGTHTDAPGNVFVGKWEDDKRTGEGKLTFANGVVCVADWENGQRQGGVFTFPNGEVYVGGWNDESLCREGIGCCTYPNGDKYEGSWKDDKRHGFGKFVETGLNRSYAGEWFKGVRCGLGVQRAVDGTYHGEFEDDVRCGEGYYQGCNGSMYRGSWKGDRQVGHGIALEGETGTQYEGLFLLGKLESYGTSRSAEDIYEGTWLDGKRQGVGVASFPDGTVLRCLWHQGASQDGFVHYRYNNGDVYEGDWSNGGRCGSGTLRYADGSVYVGEWRNDKPHGCGCFTDACGVTHVGEWCSGTQKDVRGKIQFIDGSMYEGDVCNRRPHGKGRLCYPDGTVFDGTFKNGIYAA
ncbi:MORN repeat containing protein [Trypanosoma brucei gambiense DAL972]|uniref:MORN repeat-containing protein n=1 Tax=Trypanosoma brucei gambiense (strain MHOM/CI/86/DAL972) TaxID=679716 RepID=D0A328_TRYB9|nr:MORN repeat containing protein [Trypanosoma brucei gambiense DAL972]CBH15672.1 MORN repeat containing protein [Trypanosoma brucei gambiense DAL972]|eukprot:XP_011777936.1 MORN repeat containing protein [Trypanosoma brucei gambiense DAL972]